MKNIIIILIFLLGCSQFEQKSNDEFIEITSKDYTDHFRKLGEFFLQSEGIYELKISNESLKYLSFIYQRLLINNENLFQKTLPLSFHVIVNSDPFVFSLPGGEIFMSSGLFQKYLKSEEIFIAAFSTEVLKSNRNLYEKKILIPLGFITVEKILSLTRLKGNLKKSINEWSYVVLKRSGYDGSSFLNWIQVQNRNSLDFALYLSDSLNINTEEQQFKSFLSSQGIDSFEKRLNEANSSKEYYKLLNEINKGINETRTIRKNSSRRVI